MYTSFHAVRKDVRYTYDILYVKMSDCVSLMTV